MHKTISLLGAVALLLFLPLAADADKPNILVIFGDDIGWYNTSAYNHGAIHDGRRPVLSGDRPAENGPPTDYEFKEGMPARVLPLVAPPLNFSACET